MTAEPIQQGPEGLVNVSSHLLEICLATCYLLYIMAYIIDPPPLLTSAVSPVCKQNNARLNFGSPAAQFAPPQPRVLTSTLTFLSQLR